MNPAFVSGRARGGFDLMLPCSGNATGMTLTREHGYGRPRQVADDREGDVGQAPHPALREAILLNKLVSASPCCTEAEINIRRLEQGYNEREEENVDLCARGNEDG
jgi:hypothetical protein